MKLRKWITIFSTTQNHRERRGHPHDINSWRILVRDGFVFSVVDNNTKSDLPTLSLTSRPNNSARDLPNRDETVSRGLI